MTTKNKTIIISIITVFAILLLVDRYFWAQISQWREDQATNMWLGFIQGLNNIPIGLISSKKIPNPNGMVILGFLLSALPNLLTVSFFLGILQITSIVLVGWNSFKTHWGYFLLAILPSLTSVILRSTSVEFWNQYTITLINVLFIFWAVKYLEKPSLWILPPITVLILLAPSLYLAGLANAITMTLLTIGMIAYKRPKMNGFVAVLVISVLLIVLALFLTWIPYIHNVALEQIAGYNKTVRSPINMFQVAWKAFWNAPSYITFQWADKSTFSDAFKHSDPNILSSSAMFLLKLVGRVYLLQAVFAFITFSCMVFAIIWKGVSTKNFDIKVNVASVRIVILSGLFISLSFALSILLGGPNWMENERPDQIVQFLPLFLFFIFLLPLVITTSERVEKVIGRIVYSSMIIFSVINLLCGFMIIRDHLQYRGDVLTEADVPLIDKMHAIDFIANDWMKTSNSNTIPVDYNLGGGKWDWVPEFGVALTPWYPAPMTEGRAFDYELLRRYGLTNLQEGTQLRTFGKGRYLVTYAFEQPPKVTDGQITHHIFGRVRVSVVER